MATKKPKSDKKKIPATFRLNPKIYERLEKESSDTGRTKTELLEEALRKYFKMK